MKKHSFLFFVFCFFLFSSCTTTSTVVTYDENGNIIKIENIEKSLVDKLVDSVREKSLIMWRSGWAGYVSASPATTQDPTPTLKIFAGKMDEGYISIYKEHKEINWDGVAKVISATNKSLKLSATGIEEKDNE